MLTLALLVADVKSGDTEYTRRWCNKVIETSDSYEIGKAWAIPDSWRYAARTHYTTSLNPSLTPSLHPLHHVSCRGISL